MFDGSSIRGFQAIHESDMKLIPDLDTAYLDPFRAEKTLNINFSIVDPFTDEPYSRDPRHVAAKAEAYLKSTGIADTAFFAPEAEFYIFDDVRFETKQNAGYYYIDSIEGAWNTGRVEEGGNRGLQDPVQGRLLPRPAGRPLRRPARRDDARARRARPGGRARAPRGRHRRPGGDQLPVRHAAASRPTRSCCSSTSSRTSRGPHGKTATFMPKPIFGDNGSGMHCHQSLWKDGEPLFYDERGYGGLSDTGALVHRRPAAPRAVAAGVHQPDGELLPPAGAGLRGPGQPGLLGPQPLGLRPHPGHRARTRRPSASSSACRTRRATRTWRSRRC